MVLAVKKRNSDLPTKRKNEKSHQFFETLFLILFQKETTFYKVQWADSWEPEYNLLDCKELIDEFLEQQKHEKTKSIDEEKQEVLSLIMLLFVLLLLE